MTGRYGVSFIDLRKEIDGKTKERTERSELQERYHIRYPEVLHP